MSMNSPHESVKEIAADVWKNNRPLALAFLAVLAVVGYIFYKKSQAAASAAGSSATATDSTHGAPYNITYGSITNITKTVTQAASAPVPIPTPVMGSTAFIRAKQSSGIDKGWDATHAGVPVRAQPSGSANVVRLLPFSSTVQLLQSSLTAGVNQRGGSTQWYPVQGGYLSAWDIASIK